MQLSLFKNQIEFTFLFLEHTWTAMLDFSQKEAEKVRERDCG